MASVPDIIRRDTQNVLGIDETEGGYILFKPNAIHECFPHPSSAEPGMIFQCKVCKATYRRRNQRIIRKNRNSESDAFFNIEGKCSHYWKKLSARKVKKILMKAIIDHDKEAEQLKELGGVDAINSEDVRIKKENMLALMPSSTSQPEPKTEEQELISKATARASFRKTMDEMAKTRVSVSAEKERILEESSPAQVWLREAIMKKNREKLDYIDGEVIED